jgi:D-alanyl-D-alanine carboxypeptidase
MKFFKRKYSHAAIGVLLLFKNNLYADTHLNNSLQQLVDNARQQFSANAISVAIILPGQKVPLTFVSGTVSYKNITPITPNSLFKVGSIAKTYTAELLSQAIEEKKLGLKDTIGKFLPQYPKWKGITIEQLADQTSGIMDYDQTPGWWQTLMSKPNKIWTNEKLVSISYQNENDFITGQGWGYANVNYILLSMILEKVLGVSTEYSISKLISSGNLKNTYYYPENYSKSFFKKLVHGYVMNRYDGTLNNLSWLNAAGAIISTPSDMVLWMQSLFQNGNSSITNYFSFKNTATGQPMTTDSMSGYSFGVFMDNNPTFGSIYFTPGLTSGYVSMMEYAPCLGTYFAYSISKAPAPGFQNFMTSNILRILSQSKSVLRIDEKNIPSFCKKPITMGKS